MRFWNGWIGLLLLAGMVSLPPAAANDPDGAVIVCDSSLDRVVMLTDLDGSGAVEMEAPAEITVFYDDTSPGPDLSTPSHLAAGVDGSVLLLDGGTLDSMFMLRDGNGDGDALDEGEISVYYDASGGGPKLSTPNTLVAIPGGGFYVSDDGSGAHRIIWIKDTSGDGDALDAGEARVVYDASALSVPVAEDIESLALSPSGVLYAGDTTLQAVMAFRDANGDGDFLDEGEQSTFFQSAGDLVIADIDALAVDGETLYACDSDTGRIVSLRDLTGDGDAADPGEATIYLGAGSAVAVGSVTDILPLGGGAFLLLDNSKDAVVMIKDLNGDGDALDEGESARWLADDGSTLATPSGLVLVPRREPPTGATFLRGDTTRDGRLDLSDAVAALGYLFLGGKLDQCLDALDADDDGAHDISDPIYTLNFLFLGGPAPPPPYPTPGPDPTEDRTKC